MKDGRVELTDIIGDFAEGQIVGMCITILTAAEQKKPITVASKSNPLGRTAAIILESCGFLQEGGPAMKFVITEQGKSACERLRRIRAAS